MGIKLSIDSLREEVSPLYLKYDREINPQGAYIEIDEAGEVTADSNAEIGNGIPMTVYHGRTRRIPCPCSVVGSELADFLEGEGLALLERIHAGHEVEWDGNNHVGSLEKDAQAAEVELERSLQELPTATIWSAEQWIENDSLDGLWPVGKTLEAAAEAASTPNEANEVIEGDMEAAILQKFWGKAPAWPSEAAKSGNWEMARRMIERWEEDSKYSRVSSNRSEMLDLDSEDLADAVESLWPESMSCLAGFDHDKRREVVADNGQEAEAQATLSEGLRWIKEERKEGCFDLSWLPAEVTAELVRRRVDALNEWVTNNPDPDDFDLYDSDRAERVSAEDLGITEVEYRSLVVESLACGPEGHVLTSQGRKVYAQH